MVKDLRLWAPGLVECLSSIHEAPHRPAVMVHAITQGSGDRGGPCETPSQNKTKQSAACFIDKGAEAESDTVYCFFMVLSYCVVVNTEVNNLNALVM